ncbi:MAG: hypothetical protein IV108_05875 [Burkholderiales bacterium]|nr:hypothetical protein [Burkholderiales bacterium]
MNKYEFNIRTRNGQRVDKITIQAVDRATAEQRLRQMYMNCEILDCAERPVETRQENLDVEGMINLITK